MHIDSDTLRVTKGSTSLSKRETARGVNRSLDFGGHATMLNFHSSVTSSPKALDARFRNRKSFFRASHELPALKKTRGYVRSSMDAPPEPTFLTHSEVQGFANRCRFLTTNASQSIDISSQMNSTRRSNLSTCFKAVSAIHPLFEPIVNHSGQQFRFPLKTIQEFGLT